MKILLAEDDPTLHKNIVQALQTEGFAVTGVYDGALAERILRKSSFDCVILDINLPGKNGFEVCRVFRQYNSRTAVLMLTAFNELEDKVQGFQAGADDYLTKPFFMHELLLRVKALLKRVAAVAHDIADNPIVVDDIVLHPGRKTVSRQNQPIELTPREYQLLMRLMQCPGEIVSKDELIREIWGQSIDVNTNIVEVYINTLRKKLDKPFGKQTIKTKVGYGYYLDVS